MDFHDGDTHHPVSVTRDGGAWRIGAFRAQAEPLRGSQLRVALDGVWRTITAIVDQQGVTLRDNGLTWRLTLPDPLAAGDEEETAGDRLVAPIPGLVTQVLAQPGDKVARGQVLVVLEAMKNRLPPDRPSGHDSRDSVLRGGRHGAGWADAGWFRRTLLSPRNLQI